MAERTFAWIGRNRRLAKDFEATIGSATAFLYAAAAMVLVRRIARSASLLKRTLRSEQPEHHAGSTTSLIRLQVQVLALWRWFGDDAAGSPASLQRICCGLPTFCSGRLTTSTLLLEHQGQKARFAPITRSRRCLGTLLSHGDGSPGGLPVPWQAFVELADRMIGDASKHIGEPCLRIDVVEASSLDQGVEDHNVLSAP